MNQRVVMFVGVAAGVGACAAPPKEAPVATPRADAPSASATLLGLRLDKPPLATLRIELYLHNPDAEPRWFVLPAWADQPVGTHTTAFAAELSSWTSADRATAVVPVATLLGTPGLQAIRLGAGASADLRAFEIRWTRPEPLPDALPIDVIVARELTVDGQPLAALFDRDPTVHGDVVVDRATAIGGKRWPEGPEVAVELDETARASLTISTRAP